MTRQIDPKRWVTYGEFETASRQYQAACQAFNSRVSVMIGTNAAADDVIHALAMDVEEKRSRYIALSKLFLE